MRRFVTRISFLMYRESARKERKGKIQSNFLSHTLSLSLFLDISQPPLCGSLLPFYKHFSFPYLSSWLTPSQIF